MILHGFAWRSSQTLHQSSALDQLQQSPKDVGAAVADSVVSGSREALSAAAAPRVSSASIGSPMGIFRGCAAMREVTGDVTRTRALLETNYYAPDGA